MLTLNVGYGRQGNYIIRLHIKIRMVSFCGKISNQKRFNDVCNVQ